MNTITILPYIDTSHSTIAKSCRLQYTYTLDSCVNIYIEINDQHFHTSLNNVAFTHPTGITVLAQLTSLMQTANSDRVSIVQPVLTTVSHAEAYKRVPQKPSCLVHCCPLVPDYVLLQTEIDGSCQTKVSVPVNTELNIIVPIRQKSRYNQLSLCQIRKTEIYLSSCKH